MAKFYVGQRVRIKWSNAWPELAGKEGTITSFRSNGHWAEGSIVDGTNVRVAPDCWSGEHPPYPGINGAMRFSPSTSQLEPITDSYDLVTWESMRDLWVPDHMREDA